MSILNFKKYTEQLNERYQDDIDEDEVDTEEVETDIDFQESRDLIDWMDTLNNSSNPEIKHIVNSMNPFYFRNLKRQMVRLWDEGEIDTIEDAEAIVLNQKPKKLLTERILFPTEYDKYLKDKEYMNYFNKVKDRILQLFPTQNISNIDLLIDKIYISYEQKYSIDDAVNKLYMSGDLYSFWVSNLDM